MRQTFRSRRAGSTLLAGVSEDALRSRRSRVARRSRESSRSKLTRVAGLTLRAGHTTGPCSTRVARPTSQPTRAHLSADSLQSRRPDRSHLPGEADLSRLAVLARLTRRALRSVEAGAALRSTVADLARLAGLPGESLVALGSGEARSARLTLRTCVQTSSTRTLTRPYRAQEETARQTARHLTSHGQQCDTRTHARTHTHTDRVIYSNSLPEYTNNCDVCR